VGQDIDNGVTHAEKLNLIRHTQGFRQNKGGGEAACGRNNTRLSSHFQHHCNRWPSARILFDMALPRVSRYLSTR
jgi:hypothetical protein